jgi:hypothetical protein
METKGVSSAIVSAVRGGINEQIAGIAKRPFDGANIHIVEKKFFKTIGESGTCGLSELFATNDESKSAIVYGGRKHYRKYLAMGRYLTLLGEIPGLCHSHVTIRNTVRFQDEWTLVKGYSILGACSMNSTDHGYHETQRYPGIGVP